MDRGERGGRGALSLVEAGRRCVCLAQAPEHIQQQKATHTSSVLRGAKPEWFQHMFTCTRGQCVYTTYSALMFASTSICLTFASRCNIARKVLSFLELLECLLSEVCSVSRPVSKFHLVLCPPLSSSSSFLVHLARLK